MSVEVSSLIALLRGDDDCDPVLQPGLVAAILDGLATQEGGRWTGSVFSLADYLFATDNVAPKTEPAYADAIGKILYGDDTDEARLLGKRMFGVLRDGLALWRKRVYDESLKG